MFFDLFRKSFIVNFFLSSVFSARRLILGWFEGSALIGFFFKK